MSAAMRAAPAPQAAPDAAARALAEGGIRYSAVWEDYRLLTRGLGAAARGDVVIVAGAGCNALHLAMAGARRVTAVDVNPAQTALVHFKLAAAARLTHAEFVAVLGVADAPAARRLALYDRLRPALPDAARGWWDGHPAVLAEGADGAGRLDRYIAQFRRAHLDPAQPLVRRLLDSESAAERAALFDGALCTPAFAEAFRAHFGRQALAAGGRSEAQFRHVGAVDVGGLFLARLRHACTALPTRGNPYLARFLLGTAREPEAGPPYLRAAHFHRLRARARRVAVETASLGEYLAARPARSADALALSDVFEYLTWRDAGTLFGACARALRPGGRLAYWTLFVPRRRPRALAGALRPLPRRSRRLAARDRAWFYGGFHVVARTAAPAPTEVTP